MLLPFNHHKLSTNCAWMLGCPTPTVSGRGFCRVETSSFSVKLFVPRNELLVQVMCEFRDKESEYGENFELEDINSSSTNDLM
jgi:hypothetical protein